MAVSKGIVESLALVEFWSARDQPGYPAEGVRKVRDSLLITPSFGAVWYQRLDLGWPQVRADVQDNNDSDGTTDTTEFHGARTISLDLRLLDQAFSYDGTDQFIADFDSRWDSASYWLSVLGGWMRPGRRFALYVRFKGAQTAQFLAVRPDSMSGPLVMDGSPGHIDVQLQFVCPSGNLLSFDEGPAATIDGQSQVEIALATAQNPGVAFPITFPLLFPPPARGGNSIDYNGTVPYGCVIRIYSDPVVATISPRITFQHLNTEGLPDYVPQSIGFSNLEIPPGQYVEIDTLERDVYLNGDRSQRVGQYLSRPYSFPVLRPGLNMLDLQVGASGDGAYAVVIYNNASLA